MVVDHLPSRHDSAAGNMAVDFLLLQRYGAESHARFRHYGWHRPAVTFGFSQKIAAVRAVLPEAEGVELVRRPTGGGIVDHRDDWTYALVLPRGHPWSEARAIETYRCVHQALADALRALGCPVRLQTGDAPEPGLAGACFSRAEPFDVVREADGRKVAGAAQKRSKRGLLMQGSVARAAVGELDEHALETLFVTELARGMAATVAESGWPTFDDEEVSALTEQYASAEWTEQR